MTPTQRVDFGRRIVVVRRSWLAQRVDVRSVVVCTVVVVAAVAVGVLGLITGSYPISVGQVVSALTGGETGLVRDVVIDWRLPRVLAALVFGAALGASGAVFQALTRNPLASPDVIGFATGSHTGGLIVILVTGGGYVSVAAGALAGGIATAAAVYLLAYRRGVQGFRLIVVGIGISAMLASFNTWLILEADLGEAMAAAVWGAGSLNATTWRQVVVGGGVIVTLLVACGGLSRPMRQLALGDDAAQAQGVDVERSRLALVLFGVALTATVTAAAGPIAFVALPAPQIARRLTRSAGITVAPAACVGALLLVAADFVAQHALWVQLPVGLVTVMIGGAYLGWLLFNETRRRL